MSNPTDAETGEMRPHIPSPTLDAIRQRAEAATPGPWTEWPADPMPNREVGPIDSHAVALVYERGERPVDADFIAHARGDVLALLAEVDRLRAAELTAPVPGSSPRAQDVHDALVAAKPGDVFAFDQQPGQRVLIVVAATGGSR